MKLSRRTNTIVLWVISVALLVGMIVMFTPTMGDLGGQRDSSTPAILVNGQPISEIEIARAQQGGLYSRVREGEAAQDLELLLLDQLIQQEVLVQAASRVNVSGGEVRDAVNRFREQNNVAGRNNDEAYLSLIGRVGFTDASFRDYMREQLRLEKYQTQLTEDVAVSDEEVEAFYELNRDDYRRDERIEARMIVVEDPAFAAELRGRVEAGEDFAELAAEHSLERADRGGALGAASGSSEPQPVGRAALPSEVAAVAFGLQGPGLTEVVEAGSRAYLVQVEAYNPSEVRPLDEVRAQVEQDALAAKQSRMLEEHIADLREDATVAPAEGSQYAYENEVVARVGDREIMESELVRATYTNPQIQQALGPESADLIAQFFKPTILSQLIDRELAYQGAQQLDADFVGPRALVAQDALAWVSRDVSASDEELQAYYESNRARFTVPAEAVATKVAFDELATAEAFRSALLTGADVQSAADEHGGELEDLGAVFEGDLEQGLDAALFGTDAFEPLPDSERGVSDVLVFEEPAAEGEPTEEDAEPPADAAGETDEGAEDAEDAAGDGSDTDASSRGDSAEGDSAPGDGGQDAGAAEGDEEQTVQSFVVLVAERTPERLRPFEEVRAQVEQAVLSRKRSEVQSEWLASLRESIAVENLLDRVEPDVGEAAPAEEAVPAEDEGAEEEGDGSAQEPTETSGSAEGETAAPEDAGDGTTAPEGAAAAEDEEEAGAQ